MMSARCVLSATVTNTEVLRDDRHEESSDSLKALMSDSLLNERRLQLSSV